MILLDGVTTGSRATGLFSFLDPIASLNIPVCIVLDRGEEEPNGSEENADLMQLFLELTRDYSGLVDLALGLPELSSLPGYLRMRNAGDARNRFREQFRLATGKDAPDALPQTVVTGYPNGDIPVQDGLRSAGFLNAILLSEENKPSEVWANEDGTLQVNGSLRLQGGADAQSGSDVMSYISGPSSPFVMTTQFPDHTRLNDDQLFDSGALVADVLSGMHNPSRNYFILPSELKYRMGEPFTRYLVLAVREERAGDNTRSLTAKLKAANIPFTELLNTADLSSAESMLNAEGNTCIWLPEATPNSWKNARDLAFPITPPIESENAKLPISCVVMQGEEGADSRSLHKGFDVVLSLVGDRQLSRGVDEFGTLALPVSIILDSPEDVRSAHDLRKIINEAAPDGEDVVMLVDAQNFESEGVFDRLVQAVGDVASTRDFQALNIRQYSDTVTVWDEPARLLRNAQRWPTRPEGNAVPQQEHDELLENAAVAWSFFEQMIDPDTGLSPATAWVEGESVQAYHFSTMWDTGSLILAILSAHSIGLIDEAEFSGRISTLLGNLATGRFNGLRLPKGLASTNGKAQGDDKYNASDTARLLVALHVLDSYSEQNFGLRQLLEGWDIEKTLKDGEPQTVLGNRLVSAYRSNYAGYISRAFGLWGYDVKSPYRAPGSIALMDRNVETLGEMTLFGPIGTEPHLLEAVELGHSEWGRSASEALFTAQFEEYLATGKLVCVSEGPINREPWFVYQGYQIGATANAWTVETLDPSPRFKTRGFQRAVDMLNSKAAFLWHACRPGDYHDKLISTVRQHAKQGTLGFAPGVFTVSGLSDQTYSDVNTNGVILQAIAYKLNGRKPATEWKASE